MHHSSLSGEEVSSQLAWHESAATVAGATECPAAHQQLHLLFEWEREEVAALFEDAVKKI